MIKKNKPRKRKTAKKKGGRVSTLFVLSVLIGVGVVAYLFFFSSPTKKMPLFESYRSVGTEASFKELDRRIYDALLDLDVPSKNVHFNSVEPRQAGNIKWTYSDLEVQLAKPCEPDRIKKTFSENLSSIDPKPDFSFALGAKKKIVLNVSLQTHPTHSITIIPFSKKEAGSKKPRVKKPKVAIIIDDIGYDYGMAKKFVLLDENLSISVLPHSPHQKKIATLAHNKGKDVLLHLPMEPMEFPEVDPGEGALLESMEPDALLHQLKINLDAVPYIVGVNNHMGSRLTQNSSKMRQIFTVIKRKDLFFVDSVTSSHSRCAQTAKLLQLKFARRQVFLDHVQQPHAIRLQLKRLITIAKDRGYAIGIGHPYPVTLKVLEKELSNIGKQVNIVPVSSLVR